MALHEHDQLEAATQAESAALPLLRSFPRSDHSTADDLRRYQLLVARAIDVFGDPERASFWLSTPSTDFGGEVPLRIAQHDGYSLERFEPIFIRIEHGIDS